MLGRSKGIRSIGNCRAGFLLVVVAIISGTQNLHISGLVVPRWFTPTLRQRQSLTTRAYSTPYGGAPSPSSDNQTMAMWKNILPEAASDLATIVEGMTQPSEAAQRYVKFIEHLAPNELVGKFQAQAPPSVQEAAKSTIMSILGQLPHYTLDASLLTTSTKLYNLVYQMQMTGYMLKNAEYCISMTRALKGLPKLPPSSKVSRGNLTVSPLSSDSQVRFDIQELRALSQEVEELRAELTLIRNSRENELRSNLLTYIQALPERELGKLTSDMDSSVTEAMNMLVAALMERLGIPTTTGPEVVVQQSMGALSQLAYWQLVVGYRLRELEVLDRGVTLE